MSNKENTEEVYNKTWGEFTLPEGTDPELAVKFGEGILESTAKLFAAALDFDDESLHDEFVADLLGCFQVRIDSGEE